MSTRVGKRDDTITQIDEALHALRKRVAALETKGTTGGASAVRFADTTPLANAGAGAAGDDQIAARADHVHPAVQWTDIADRPDLMGVGQDRTYRHVQITAADAWTFRHGLDKYPALDVIDSSGELVIGEVHYLDRNTVRIDFSAAISGEAYCN